MIDSEFTSSHLGYSWAPLTSDIVTGCNDTNNSFESKQFISGSLDFNSSLEQVGRYKFNILDTTWTKVDTDPYQMDFHVSPYYIPASTPDCTPNSSAVSSNNPYSGIKNGCNISSSHTNVDTGATYRDYNITFHPYEFDISSISLTKNPLDVNVSNNDFVYMQDLAQNDNMSLHLNGNIRAVSETNTTLSNFVDSCFAKPLTITVDTSDTNHTVPYQYNFIVLDNSRTVDANITGVSTGFSLNTLTSDFVKASNGSTSTVLNMNYFRSKSNAVNPKRVTYNSYDVNCTVPSNCAFSANLNNMTTSASNNFNLNVSHLYGRTNAPRKVFTGDSGNSFVYFESYCLGCNKALLPNGILSASTNDPRWFVNTFHTASDGVVGDITQKNASNINDVTNPAFGAPTQVTLNYNENAGYPYKATMENNASSWLIFNQYNAADTTNEFEVEFVNSSADWAGVDGANSATENNATTKTNRRIMW
jgi:hypothetical protein